MKYIIPIICWLLFLSIDVNASELIGKISTDPKVLADIVNGTSPEQTSGNQSNAVSVPSSSGANELSSNQTQELKSNYQTIYSVAGSKSTRQIKILGISLFPDNSLLRNTDHRIYLVKSGFKKHILSLKELQKYRGQSVYDVIPAELAYYQTRGHLDGELIKEKGRHEIYVIVNGKRQRISGLVELKKYYRGLEIFNVSHEEMDLYK